MYNFNTLFADGIQAANINLSSDEMDVLANEEQQATQDYNLALAQSNTLWDRFEAMSTVAAVTATVAEGTPALVGAGYHMAGIAAHVATQGLPENVREVNAFESDGEKFDLVLAGEDFKSIITSIWNAIKKGRDKVWRFLKRMWSKSVGRYARLRRSLVGLQEKAEGVMAEGKSAEEKNVDISSGVPTFHYAGKAVTDCGTLLGHYGTMADAAKFFYGDYLDAMKKQLPNVEKAVSNANIENVQATSDSIGKAMNNLAVVLFGKAAKCLKTETGKNIGSYAHISTTASASNISLWAILGNSVIAAHKEGTLEADAKISAVTTSLFGIYDWDTKKKNYPDSVTMQTASLEQVRSFCVTAIEATDQILATIGKSEIDKLGDVSNKINKALDKYKSDVAKSNDAAVAKETATVSSILGATKKVDSWLTHVTNAIGSNYAAQTSAIAGYMSKSVSMYK